MKIKDYPSVSSLKTDDLMLVETQDYGTRTIPYNSIRTDVASKVTNDLNYMKPNSNVIEHRKFRGNNIGSSFTSAQISAIANGTYDNIYVGDYWVIGDNTWYVADIKHWQNLPTFGNNGNMKNGNHICVIPARTLGSSKLATADNFVNGPQGFTIQNYCTNSLVPIAKTAFGSGRIGTFVYYDVTSYGMGGEVLSVGLTPVEASPPTAVEILGYSIFDQDPSIQTAGSDRQLSLFRQYPEYIYTNSAYWLRSKLVAKDGHINGLRIGVPSSDGSSFNNALSDIVSILGVRPIFCVF